MTMAQDPEARAASGAVPASDEDSRAFKAFEAAGWTERAATYCRLVARVTVHAAEPLLDAAAVGAGSRLLDVGSGPGDVAGAGTQRGAEATGVDIAQPMVELARERHPDVRFLRGDAEELPFEDASFDAAVAGFVLNHVARPQALAAELARVLTPGGRAALSVWDVPARVPLFGALIAAAEEVGAVPPPLPPAPDFFHFADEDAFRGLLAGAGLAEARVETVAFAFAVGDAAELWEGILGGSVRIAAVVRAQDEERRERIRAAFSRRVERFERNGRLELPVSLKVGSGMRR